MLNFAGAIHSDLVPYIPITISTYDHRYTHIFWNNIALQIDNPSTFSIVPGNPQADIRFKYVS